MRRMRRMRKIDEEHVEDKAEDEHDEARLG